MNTIPKIRIARCSGNNGVPFESRLLAVIHLNNFEHEKGQPVMVPYLKSNGKIDTIVAIGLDRGTGPDCYSIISEGGKLYVAGVYEELPDVSSLVHNVPYVAKVGGEWKLIYISEDNTTRIIGDLDPDDVIYNLDDSHNYFYKDGRVFRDDNAISLLEEELDLLRLGKINIEASLRGENTYKQGTSARPVFDINVSSDTGENLAIDPNCTVSVTRGNEIPVNGYLSPSGDSLVISEETTNTTEYTITATYTRGTATLEASTKVKVWFVAPVLYGESNTEALWNGQGPLVLLFNLNDQKSKVRIPSELLDGNLFSHIYDAHGLDYIEDYRTFVEGNYRVYEKLDAVTINNFKQEFTI